ncbi:MAG: phosphoenolpyruvate--protein phosphotransferase [Rhodospirillales bacterium]|nr:phosphoenolpyruvate--protein phosphotransferase [Rhodospirillales bacterium]
MAGKTTKEKHLKGLGVSSGIGIGIAQVRDDGAVRIPHYRIAGRDVEAERSRFRDAIARTRRQIRKLQDKAREIPGSASDEIVMLFDAYLQMLADSRLVRGVDSRIASRRLNAEAAVEAEIAAIGESFMAIGDAYITARIADIRDIGSRLIRNLTRAPERPVSGLPKGSIVVSSELTPADTARLQPHRIAGAVAVLGGAEGHTAIMARALSIPTVLGVSNLLKYVRTGDTLVIDGTNGHIVVNPTPATLAVYVKRREERAAEKRLLVRLRRQPAVTRNGTAITLQANVELPIEMGMVKQSGAIGIGLLRTEFMFMNRDDIPGEEDQYQALREIVEAMNGRPVTIRTLDIGGEKISDTLVGNFGPSVASPLGLRGIRLSLSRVDILEAQFRAILRAAAHGPIRILLPMVTTCSEVRRARSQLERVARRLKREGVRIPRPLPPCGVMIEVPAAALAADALSRLSDFFAIGTNDLIMYTLATDRADEQVAPLFDPLHPAVLRLMQGSAEAALRAGIPVSICGEMAGDPRFTALLLGLGFRNLSMAPANVPRVKKCIRALDLDAATQRARIIMDQVDSGRIAALLDDFNALA